MSEKKLILIVDDVRLFHLTIQQALACEEYELVFKTTGKDALEFIMKRKIHLLILDLYLPDMNGLEVLRNIRRIDQRLTGVCDEETISQLKNFPVIVVSAFLQDRLIKEIERMGVAGCMAKPVSKSKLRAIVEEALRKGYGARFAGKKVIMCVDNEHRVREFYQGALSDAEYDVITSVNAVEALEKIEFQHIDLIITELNLPEMSGLEFLQILNESAKHIPIIIVSTVSEEKVRQQTGDLPVQKILSKPVNLNELRKCIKEILNPLE